MVLCMDNLGKEHDCQWKHTGTVSFFLSFFLGGGGATVTQANFLQVKFMFTASLYIVQSENSGIQDKTMTFLQ